MTAFRKMFLPFFMVACMPFVAANSGENALNDTQTTSETATAEAKEQCSTADGSQTETSTEVVGTASPSDESPLS